MFRTVATRLAGAVRNGTIPSSRLSLIRPMSSKHAESDEEFDARYESYFNRPNIDGWEVRQAMNDLAGMDLVPEPKIVIAALKACRRINDHGVAVRFLEVIREKSLAADKSIYPYILQEIRPTLEELGISTPEELGYDKPELALANVFEMH